MRRRSPGAGPHPTIAAVRLNIPRKGCTSLGHFSFTGFVENYSCDSNGKRVSVYRRTDRPRSLETHIFVGRGYVVSVRHGASASYTPVRKRCEASPKVLAHGEDYILYAILDYIADNYMPVLDAIETEVGVIEDRVLTGVFGARSGAT